MNKLTFILIMAFWLVIVGPVALAFDPLFDARIDYPVGDGPVSVFSVDLDGDADFDLAVANISSGNFRPGIQTDTTLPADSNGGTSVADFLCPDGRFDLEAARRSGYQGPLDIKGYIPSFDSASRQPVFRTTVAASPADDPDDIYWDNSISPSIPGANGNVGALTVYDGRLIVGGYFQVAGDVIANGIAAWDGSSWSPLGSGMNKSVVALTVYDNQLIAGGSFTEAGGVAANYIAAWDGSSWSPLGSGMGGVSYPDVYALTVYDNRLIAGGYFTTAGGVAVNGIAAWNGSTWSPLGSGMNSAVYALTVYDNRLIPGGSFTTAGGVAANKIAAWDGSSWSPLGSGTNCFVRALTVYDNQLIAGGDFTTAGGVWVNYIAAWDGSSWSPLGLRVNYYVRVLTVYDNRLIAGGSFTTAGGVAANKIAVWDGSSWSPLGSGMNSAVYALTVYDNRLIAGGSFTTAGGVAANRIAAWDGSSWSPLGSGMNPSVGALTVYDNELIAGGWFTMAGGVAANRIAAWDGSSWSPLGSGMNDQVGALTVYDDQLIAGGVFHTAGGVAANSIAAWDGSSWSPLGSGVNDRVFALTVYDNQLIAGGWFTTAGGVAANSIAAWDGSSWSPLGSGVNDRVFALTVYDNRLIAGGSFTTAGGVAVNYVAAWNGSSWSPLGSGMNNYVLALTVYDNRLIAGGSFTTAGGVAANYVAAWNGSSWSPLGSGMNGQVGALTVYDDQLIAGGVFHTAGGVRANCIAAWDGSSWSALGSGMDNYIRALTVYDNRLIAGGSFTIAGGKVSAYIAQWTKGAAFCASFTGLFCDDFEDGIITEWQDLRNDGCAWIESNGNLSTSVTGYEQWCIKTVGNQSWDNYILEGLVKGNSGVDKVLVFRIQDQNNFYAVNLRSDYPSSGIDQVTFDKMVDSVYNADIVTADYPSTNGVWYHVKIACVDNSFQVFVNSTPVLEYTDNNSAYYTGGIGVASWTGFHGNCDVSFDNVTVTDPFPYIVFDNVAGTEIGENLTITGQVQYVDGSVYTPLAPGTIGCEDPISFKSRSVSVDASGTFSMTTVNPISYAGLYHFKFGANHSDMVVSQHLFMPVSEAYDPIHPSVQTGLAIGVGATKIYTETNQAISVQFPLVPSWELFSSPAIEFYQIGKTAWQRATTSPTGKVITGLRNLAFEGCSWSPSNWGGCMLGADIYALQVIQASQPFSLMAAAFDNTWNRLKDDGHLTQSDVDWLSAYMDVAGVVQGVWKATLSKEIISGVKAVEKLSDAVLTHSKVLIKKIGLKDAAIEEILVQVVDDSGNVYFVMAYPKRENTTRISSWSPVDLVVTNPAGLSVSKTLNEIDGAEYVEYDFDNDGELEDQILIPDTAFGQYEIQVVPEDSALATDSFSLYVENSYWTDGIVLAENEMIGNIPPTPYTCSTFFNLPPDGFAIVAPKDTAFYEPLSVSFVWESSSDPNPGHRVLFDLLIASDSLFVDTVIVYSLTDTTFLYTDTLPSDTIDNRFFWKVRGHDLWGASTLSNQTYSFRVGYICGDADGSGSINILDITFLIKYLYKGGPAPDPLWLGDGNGSGSINLLDITYLINYLYKGGPEPVCP